jgi:hypothetical protein
VAKVRKIPERRELGRYAVERHALTMLWPASSIVGRILDISMDGLAFQYTAPKKPQDASSDIEIVLSRADFSSGALPFRTVSDSRMKGYFGFTFARTQRRRSIQFKELAEDQKAKLEYFIENYCWRIPE